MMIINNVFRFSFVVLILYAFLTSCNSELPDYYHIVNENEATLIEGETRDYLENGFWSIATDKGELKAYGEFENGMKKDVWNYSYKDTSFKVNWKIYSLNDDFQINIPKNWDIIKNNIDLFQSTFPTKSDNKLNKYYIIGATDSAKLGLSQLDYLKLTLEDIYKSTQVFDVHLFILRNGESEYYFSRFQYKKQGENLLVYSFIGIIQGELIDIGYSSLNEMKDSKELIFFETLVGCYYKNNRIVNPFKPIVFREIAVSELR
jgi:hypothetical protein